MMIGKGRHPTIRQLEVPSSNRLVDSPVRPTSVGSDYDLSSPASPAASSQSPLPDSPAASSPAEAEKRDYKGFSEVDEVEQQQSFLIALGAVEQSVDGCPDLKLYQLQRSYDTVLSHIKESDHGLWDFIVETVRHEVIIDDFEQTEYLILQMPSIAHEQTLEYVRNAIRKGIDDIRNRYAGQAAQGSTASRTIALCDNITGRGSATAPGRGKRARQSDACYAIHGQKYPSVVVEVAYTQKWDTAKVGLKQKMCDHINQTLGFTRAVVGVALSPEKPLVIGISLLRGQDVQLDDGNIQVQPQWDWENELVESKTQENLVLTLRDFAPLEGQGVNDYSDADLDAEIRIAFAGIRQAAEEAVADMEQAERSPPRGPKRTCIHFDQLQKAPSMTKSLKPP